MAAVATLLTDSLARFQSFLKDELTGLAVNLEQHTGNSGGDRSAWLGDVVHMLSKTYQQALAASLTRTQLLESEAVQAVIAALQGGRSKQQQLSGGIAGDAGNGTDQQLAESNGAAHQAAAGAGGAAEGRSSSSQEGTSAGGDTGPDTPANETRSQSWGKYTASIPSDAQDSLETMRAAEAGGDQASNAAAAHGSLIRTLLSNQAPAQQFDSQASSASSRSTSGDGASRGLNGLLPGHSSDGISPTAAAAAAAATNNNLTSIGSGNAAGALYSDGDLLTNQVLQQYRDQFSTGTLPSSGNAAAVLSLANQRMSRANQQQQSQQQQQQQQQFHNFGDHHGLSAPGVQGRMSMPGGDWSHSSGAGGAHGGGGGGGTGHISGRLSESNLVLPQQFKDMHLGSAHSSRPVSPYSTDGGLTSVASTGGRMGAADMSNTNRSAQQQQSEHASLTSAYAAAARQLAPSGPSSPQTSWLDSPPSHDSSQQQQGQGQQPSQHLDAATLLSLASLQQQQHLQFLHQGNNANANTGMDVSLNPEVGVPRALLNNASPEMLNLLQASGVNLGGGSDNTAQSNASAAAAALQAAGLLEGLSNFNTSSNSAAAGSGHAGGSQSGPLPRISNLGAMHSLQQQQQQQSRNSGQLPYQNAGYGQGGYGNQSDMYQSDPSFSLFGDRLFELQPIGQDSGSLPTSAQRTLNLFAAAAAAANGGGMQDGGMGGASSAPINLGNPAFNAMNLGMLGGTDADLLDVSIGMHPHINAAAPSALSMASIGGLASLGSGGHSGTFGSAGMRLVSPRMSMSGLDSRTSPAGSGPSSPLPPRTADMPARFRVLPAAVQQRIVAVCRANPVISLRDFDDKVVNKLSLLVEAWGVGEALAMLDHLEQRMRTKQGVMKNGPGYLDVAVCSHLDMLKAQGSCPKTMKLEDYAMQVLSPPVFHELQQAVSSNRWLAWEHFDQGIIQLVKKLPRDSAVEKLQEITFHSFKNVDNIKGCIMSILNSKIREDRRRQ